MAEVNYQLRVTKDNFPIDTKEEIFQIVVKKFEDFKTLLQPYDVNFEILSLEIGVINLRLSNFDASSLLQIEQKLIEHVQAWEAAKNSIGVMINNAKGELLGGQKQK